ncbi:Chemotaxis protein CheW [Acaryochloris thomasi RCC1774]|uniref:Chemotaxis protein CheW n=1 Tax=Acaryochloris thomasi RCC1774 TaxID=1764569 RepID=A0A2W1J8S6_9CYAN|nr:chemotaxis protein CheW [Acaryochloris thomasi]PZD70536.1 Chemotaxis protein CheW [Acaryochloris thomasi RCC1774]
MDTDNQSYLIFRHSDSLYGVEASRVREIFHLPELQPIADAPKDIIGSLNWRGKLLPVMHLDLRLGQSMLPCQLSDSIIVIEWQGIQVGLVVHQVLDVQTIAATDHEAAPDYGRLQQINTAFVAGVAKVEADLVVLLNPETLIRQADDVAMMIWEAELSESNTETAPEAQWQTSVTSERSGSNFYELYCQNVTPAERAIFRQRADALRPPLEEGESNDQVSLAVVGLGENYFALELDRVREFINVQQVTPIPCCPPHIVGNMNLRGEVMTLVDLRTVLTQAPAAAPSAKAIVVEVDDIIAGIPVDAVFDVMSLSPTDISAIPLASSASHQRHFQGTARYNDKTLSILNLSALFSNAQLTVDQAA